MTIRPIETVYKGYRMRSRLEARWAVFLDSLGIPWEYEKEGYDLGGVPYLCDFWLPEQCDWFEVKPHAPTDGEEQKAEKLALETDSRVTMGLTIPSPWYEGLPGGRKALLGYSPTLWAWTPGIDVTNQATGISREEGGMEWTICPTCGYAGITLWGNTDDLHCRCPHAPRGYRGALHPRIEAAYDAARQARFEFGEHGEPGMLPSYPEAPKVLPRPRETIYKGHRFLSQLEARWAVFFDALDLKWLYRKREFVLLTGEHFEPSFWLSNVDRYADVTPGPLSELSEEEEDKYILFAQQYGHPCLMLDGVPTVQAYWGWDIWEIDGKTEAMARDYIFCDGSDFPQTTHRVFASTGATREGDRTLDPKGYKALQQAVDTARQISFRDAWRT
ncbi:MAG: hypothetical protein ACLQUY_12630 [Ktedonobacterales bacterium]